MKRKYLVFNIHNCAEDYVAVSELCDAIFARNQDHFVPDQLLGNVYVYEERGENKAEKLFFNLDQRLRKNRMEPYEAKKNQPNSLSDICLRIEHDPEDVTIEYLYLAVLMHKFPNLLCLLYINGSEQEKYAVWNKAVDFFLGFQGEKKQSSGRVYGEYYDKRSGIWSIEVLNIKKDITKHTRVNPMIELDDTEMAAKFWRTSIGRHELTENGADGKYRRVMELCEKNFIEDNKGNSDERNTYYQNIYKGKDFQDATRDMPLLAYYLFCMQVYYAKEGKRLELTRLKQIRINAWDIADGILQLIENIHHTTGKIGFMEIRVHKNKQESKYLRERYGITDKENSFYYEIRLMDISDENIVESFQKRSAAENIDKMRVSHFFERCMEGELQEFWEQYNQNAENLVHHYGLQVFAAIVSANKGIFKVVSSSRYQFDPEKDSYVNSEDLEKVGVGQAHLPGTEYVILLPLREPEQGIVTSVETDAEYAYDMQTDYRVNMYVDSVNEEDRMEYNNQEEKEGLINQIGYRMYGWMQNASKDMRTDQRLVLYFSVQKWRGYPLEIYCKAVILCAILCKKLDKKEFYCIIDDCENNHILEIARLFAIYYCKAGVTRYLSDMQIFLSGEDGELLITGGDLNSLYAITSKVMLVKGINQKTTDILKYLIGQYGKQTYQEKTTYASARLVPFEMLDLPKGRMTLFEKQVYKTLNTDIQNYSLGCRIEPTHMRIGSKLHIGTFYEAELLFHNNYYISRFANLILRKLPLDKGKKLILVGYETYSELLLYKIVAELQSLAKDKEPAYQASYMVYEQRIGSNFRYMDENCLKSEKPLQFAVVIPINSTLTTHNKVRRALNDELERKGVLEKKNLEIVANYALILIRSSQEDEEEKVEELEKLFWDEIEGRRIKTSLIPEGEPDIEYFVCVRSRWYLPLKCPICFPDNFTEEKPLFETDRTSVVPVQMIGIREPDLISRTAPEKDETNLERVKALGDSLVYRHLIRNGNHYLYYFCLEHYFIQEREHIIEWLKGEKSNRKKVESRNVYDIIVSPLHFSDAGFLAEVNHYLFDNAALVLNFEVENEFRENVKTKYSNIIGLYYNLHQMGVRALIRFHFVDDSIISGRTFERAKSIFQSLVIPEDDSIQVEVFSDIIILLNRMSTESIRNLTGSGRMEHFHAYVNLNISSMRSHEDACTECKLETNFTNLREQSSTNQQYRYWNDKIRQHKLVNIQNKMWEELLAGKNELRKRAYRRMLCSHLANERLSELKYLKNDTNQVRRVMIELMSEQDDDKMEWIISYIKVLSRPFISFSKSSREAIFQIMLWLIEYIVERLMWGQTAVRRDCREVTAICKSIREAWGENREQVYQCLLILMKRLSDLGSNYIIRKKNLLRIHKKMGVFHLTEEKKEEFEDRYIGIIKRICCQSSDESKSMFLEHLLLYGEEYGEISRDEREEDSIECLVSERLPMDNTFAWRVFLENTRVLIDGVHDLTRDISNNRESTLERAKEYSTIIENYYYDNFKRLLQYYGYCDRIGGQDGKEKVTEEGAELLDSLVEMQWHLKEDVSRREEDAEVYYKGFLQILEKLTGAGNCYLLYGPAENRVEATHYYRIQANGDIEYLEGKEIDLKTEQMIADTLVPPFLYNEYDTSVKRAVLKYDIYGDERMEASDTVYLQMDFPKEYTERKIFILLKMVMLFHNMLLQHLRKDFTNNMIQKWSSREYFNKQMLLQRATDHTDRDNLQKY